MELVNLENVLGFTEDGINVTLTHGQGVEDERVHRRVSKLRHEAVKSLTRPDPVLQGLVLGLDGAGGDPRHEEAGGHEGDGGEHGHVC